MEIGMAIPWRISFLEESRSRGMTDFHSSGIEEYEIYSSGSSGNFEEWVLAKILKIPPKLKKKIKKKFQHWIHILRFWMFGNNTKKWSVILKNRNKNRKILKIPQKLKKKKCEEKIKKNFFSIEFILKVQNIQ